MSDFPGATTEKPRGRPKGTYGVKSTAIREHVIDLTHEYDVMTVRQVFYALVSRGVVPKEENAGYRPVQRVLLEMRHEGDLPWGFIADGTRWQRRPETWDTVQDAAATLARTYRRDLWRGQGIRIEVWLEKDALASVVAAETDAWDVALMVSRGVSSATFLYGAVQQANDAADHGVMTMIYTLFDYDAGGARAKKMIRDYFDQYARASYSIVDLAVSANQVRDLALPTRPAKRSDPQADKWGDVAVELDAIDPVTLRSIVKTAIVNLIDPDAWEQEQIIEQSERTLLERIVGTIGGPV